MKQHKDRSATDGLVFSESVAVFSDIAALQLPSAHTVLLLNADAKGVPSEVLAQVAERLFAQGLCYLCAWGPDCERVHDAFDAAYRAAAHGGRPGTFVSTWHRDEPLQEALWFFLKCAIPPEGVPWEATSYLAVTVGCADWAQQVECALEDQPGFVARVLAEEISTEGTA